MAVVEKWTWFHSVCRGLGIIHNRLYNHTLTRGHWSFNIRRWHPLFIIGVIIVAGVISLIVAVETFWNATKELYNRV